MIDSPTKPGEFSQEIVGSLRSSVRFVGGLGLVAQFVAATVVVLSGTLIAALLSQIFDLARLAVFFLGSVVVCALLFDRRVTLFAAFLAFIAYNFSLVEPRFTPQFAGPEDALTLAVFLIVAVLVGSLANQVRESERSSRLRADLLETLLRASRVFSAVADADALRAELAAQLRFLTGEEAFVLADSTTDAGFEESILALARDAEAAGHMVVRGHWRAQPLSGEGHPGVAVWRATKTSTPDPGSQDRLCALLIDLAAAALDRVKLVDLQTEIDASARAGQLRDAILGSISHDLRTPLATVLASASSLRDYGQRFDAVTRRDLADVIVQEAERLNVYLESLLVLSQIDAGQIAPSLGPVPLIEVVDAAVRRLDPAVVDDVHTEHLDQTLEVEADGTLLEQVIFNLLDNAFVHGGPSVQVDIRARRTDAGVELAIDDNGAGASADEYAQLCDKFYRGKHRRSDARGTGIGLSIAKGFVEAMAGAIDIGPSRINSRGLRVAVTLVASPGGPS